MADARTSEGRAPDVGKACDSDRPELIEPTQFFGLHRVRNIGDLTQRNLLCSGTRVDVKVPNIGKLRSFLHAQSCDDWDLLVAFTQRSYLITVDSRSGGGRHIADL